MVKEGFLGEVSFWGNDKIGRKEVISQMEVGDCSRQWVEGDMEAAVGVRKIVPRDLVV